MKKKLVTMYATNKKKFVISIVLIIIFSAAIAIQNQTVSSKKEEEQIIIKKNKENNSVNPEAPIVRIPTTEDELIKGTGTKSADVFVEIDEKKIAEGKVNDNGEFGIQIPKQNENAKIRVYTKKENQTSLSTVVTVILAK